MKTIFATLLLSSLPTLACSTYEAQIMGEVRDIKYTAPYECVITLDINLRKPGHSWAPHYICPLNISDVLGKLITVKSCDLEKGSKVSGYLVRTGESIELE